MYKVGCLFLFLISHVPGIAQRDPNKEEVLSLVKRVADYGIRNSTYLYFDRKEGTIIDNLQRYGYQNNIVPQSGYNDWKYWTGVMHLGYNRLGEVVQDKRYQQYAKKNFEYFFRDRTYLKRLYTNENVWSYPLAQSFIVTELDYCGAMGASLIELYQQDDSNQEYKAFIDEAADHILHKQARLNDGTLARHRPARHAVWADDLYMSVIFLSRMANLSGDRRYFDDACKQVIQFNQHLYDERTGLMWHAYFADDDRNGGAFWGRCNGWMMMATAELLSFLPASHPQRNEMLNLLRRQIKQVRSYQGASGMWHQLLDKSDSYEETSCTAMFTYTIALAVNQKWVDPTFATVALDGWKGLTHQITENGEILGVCAGSGIGNDLAFYYTRPTPINDLHGVGPILLAGSEVYKMLDI